MRVFVAPRKEGAPVMSEIDMRSSVPDEHRGSVIGSHLKR